MNEELELLRDEIRTLKHVIGTAISWIAQSANSPLRVDEAEALIKMMEDIKK